MMAGHIVGLYVLTVILLTTVHGQLTGSTDPNGFTDPITCNSDSECNPAVHLFAICEPIYDNITIPITMPDGTAAEATYVGVVGGYCKCDTNLEWFKVGDTCIYDSTVGEVCNSNPDSRCIVPNSECLPDGYNTGRMRCQCTQGYTLININGTDTCSKVLTYVMDGDCEFCEQNDGVCYDATGDNLRDGCICPTSRSGDDCETTHVEVMCDVGVPEMRICYTPHEGVNLTANASMATEGNAMDEFCRGKPVEANDTFCPPGSWTITLPLSPDLRDRCATKEFLSDVNIKKFESTIVVQRDSRRTAPDDIIFKTFCSFKTHAETSFNPIGVLGPNGNDQGEHKNPTLAMYVENHFGDEIPDGVALKLGDKIRLKILLTADGSYSSIRVRHCSASSSASVPDHKAMTLPLVIDSCPYEQQQFITMVNNWRTLANDPAWMSTGLIKMFKLPVGNSVFIHCSVKLCLVNNDADCAEVTCDGQTRKRRAVEDDDDDYQGDKPTVNNMDLSKELIWYTDDSEANTTNKVTLDKTYFGILLALLIILLIIFILITIFLLIKVRSKNPKIEDSAKQKPQRFAMPRIAPNQRI